MTTKHLNDEQLQQYVLDESSLSGDIAAHIHSCEDCRARAKTYRMLITIIEQAPSPVFEFDLQELVLSKIPEPVTEKKTDNLIIRVVFLPALFFVVAFISLLTVFSPGFFAGIGLLAGGLLVVSAVFLLATLCMDMYKSYKKKINLLDLY